MQLRKYHLTDCAPRLSRGGMDTLPLELVSMTFGWTDTFTISMLALVCPTWYALARRQQAGLKALPRDSSREHRCLSQKGCATRALLWLIGKRRWALVEWMRVHVMPFGDRTFIYRDACAAAAYDGDLPRLCSLCGDKVDLLWYGVITKRAARYGHMHVLQWLHERGTIERDSVCRGAAKGGHLHILEWSQTIGYEVHQFSPDAAAKYGRLEVLKWLRDQEGARDRLALGDTSESARRLGDTVLVWTPYTCAFAAARGDIESLQWLRSVGCPWNAETCSRAALGGHLDIIQWARANGCPWDTYTYSSAARGGHLDTLQWVYANGCPSTESAYEQAAARGHVHVLEWLWEKGCPRYDNMLILAARLGQIVVAQWALDHGYEWQTDLCSTMCWHGHLAMLEWAVASKRSWHRYDCSNNAKFRGHGHIVRWIKCH